MSKTVASLLDSPPPMPSSTSPASLASLSGTGVTGTVVYQDFGGTVSDNPVTRPASLYVTSIERDPGRAAALVAARQRLSGRIEACGERSLRAIRLGLGLSQAALASLVNTSQARIARIESGKEDVSLSFARKLASALKIDIASLSAAMEK